MIVSVLKEMEQLFRKDVSDNNSNIKTISQMNKSEFEKK